MVDAERFLGFRRQGRQAHSLDRCNLRDSPATLDLIMVAV